MDILTSATFLLECTIEMPYGGAFFCEEQVMHKARLVPSRERMLERLEHCEDLQSVLVLWHNGLFSVVPTANLSISKIERYAVVGRLLDMSHWPFLPTPATQEYLDGLYNELVGEWETFWRSYDATRVTWTAFLPATTH